MPNRQKDHKELLFYLKVWIEFKKYVKRNRNWYANELHSNDNPTTTTISKLLLCLLLTHRPYLPYTISCLIRKFYMIPSRDNPLITYFDTTMSDARKETFIWPTFFNKSPLLSHCLPGTPLCLFWGRTKTWNH